MKKDNKIISQLNKTVMAAAKQSVNSACVFIHYQPVIPEELTLKYAKDKKHKNKND